VPTTLYHFTHVDNLEAILAQGGLVCLNRAPTFAINAASNNIQERRKKKQVICEPRGTLHDYVPFYFAPRSPMMFKLSKGGVSTFQGNIHDLVYIVSSIEKIKELGYPFTFMDGHALMALSNFYNDTMYLDKLDWKLIRNTMWNNTDEDNDRERRRQAEFLVKGKVGLDAFNELGVYSQELAKRVFAIMKGHNVQCAIRVKRNWYY
jgi:hypothetical protein